MLESTKMEVVKISRDDLERRLIELLPGYMLLEKLRIHDFHRFGALPRQGWFMGGMLRLKVQGRHAAISHGADGPETSKSRNSMVIGHRPLHMEGDRVFDEEADQYVTIDSVLARYLEAIPQAIAAYRSL